MTINEFFVLQPDFTASLNQEWISLIPEFKRLIVRDRSVRKSKATAEFTYLTLRYGFGGPFENLSEGNRILQSIKASGVSDDVLKDKDFIEAEKMFLYLRDNISKSYQSYITMQEYVDKTSDSFSVMFEELNNLPIDEKILASARLQKSAESFPKVVKACNELRTAVKGEFTDGKITKKEAKGFTENGFSKDAVVKKEYSGLRFQKQ